MRDWLKAPVVWGRYEKDVIEELQHAIDDLGTKLAYHAQNEFTTENIKIRETCPAEREDVPWLVRNAAAFQAEFARSKNKILQEQNDTLRARCERLVAVVATLNTPQQWADAAEAESGVTFTPQAVAHVAAAMVALQDGDLGWTTKPA